MVVNIAIILLAVIAFTARANGQIRVTNAALGGTTAGRLVFSPLSASFGNVAVGSSRTIAVTITNAGLKTMKIGSESVQATGYTASGLSFPESLSPGGSVILSVKFSPTSSGLQAGSIALKNPSGSVSVNYAVSGTGVNPAKLAATPASVSFGAVAVATGNSQTVQLKNTGGTSLSISSAVLSGSGFTMSGLTIPQTLAPAQTVNFTVGFTTSSLVSEVGSITLKSNASDGVLTVALSGSGTAATRTISVSANSLNFGNELVGASSSQAVTLKNTGNSSVTLSQISVSGTGFSATGGLSGATIAAGQTAQLGVVFAPASTGTDAGKITIASNASNSPESITLAGTGVSSTAHSVTLDWAASTTVGVTGYNVYRSTTSGSAFAKVSSTLLTALKYTDAAVVSGRTYYYVVTAVSGTGVESGYSGQVAAAIP